MVSDNWHTGGTVDNYDYTNEVPLEIQAPWTLANKRAALLGAAENAVNGDRNVQYGDPKADFKRIAALWTTYLLGIEERTGAAWQLEPHDVASMMTLLKVSRIVWSPDKADHWLDIAGYAACGYDCSEAQL